MYNLGNTINLSEEEIREQIKIIQNGTPEEVKNAKEKIIKQFIKYIYNFSYKIILPKGYEVDDIISCAAMSLLKAAEKFDLDKTYEKENGEISHIKFFSFAVHVMKNDVFMEMRKASKINDREIFSLNEMFADKDGNTCEKGYNFPDIKPNCIEQHIENDSAQKEIIALKKAIDKLPPRERAVIEKKFFSNSEDTLKDVDVAKNINLSQSYICRIKNNAFKKISAYLAKAELLEQ